MNEIPLCVVVPYLCLATFVVGHLWRYRYDKFGWTTRSSQLYENRLLRIGSPLFHFGMLGVVGGHVIGLLRAAVVDRRGRHQRARLPRGRRRRRPRSPASDRGRHGDPDLPPPHRRPGLLRHHAHGQGDVRLPRHRDRAGHVEHHRRLDPDRRRRVQLPRRRLGLVPLVPPLPPGPGADGGRAAGLPAARTGRLRAVRAVALHPAGARLQRTGGLPDPPLHRLPQPRRQLGSHRPRRGWDRVGS